MTGIRLPIDIDTKPWHHDHRFAGRTVFPAVETMILLAGIAVRRFPELDISCIFSARFPKFLELDPDLPTAPALAELEDDGERVRAVLASKVRLKACSKLQIHGELVFGRRGSASPPPVPQPPEREPKPLLQVDAERIYRELVPFGPMFRTLAGTLTVSEYGAEGIVAAPSLPATDQAAATALGSPFPLDGALHAACVCGQRLVDWVPFPTGFTSRRVVRPTVPGGRYRVRVVCDEATVEELVFSVWISDGQGVCEHLDGVRMRDVSRGGIRPPAWLRGAPSPMPADVPSTPSSASA